MAGNGIGVNAKRRTRRGRSKEKEPDVTVCPMCSNKMENPVICQNTLVQCPDCNEILLVSENSQQKFLSPISWEISESLSPEHVPEVCTAREQYDLALADPRYFDILLELVSVIKNRPLQVPVICRGKELNLHRMFVEVTCRGGILKVCQQRRLQEVCAALAENLGDWDLYNIYMTVLYDLESCFPPGPPLRPCTSYNKLVVVPRLREEEHSPPSIQPSAPYTNAAASVNNNNNQQWTSFPAGFNIGSTCHSDTSSFGPCPMPGVILNGGQPCPTGLKQGQPSEWIEASARFANSEPVKNNPAVD
ncbi:hypothetical protein GQ457_04G025660 [Hibiscus cannabinus]